MIAMSSYGHGAPIVTFDCATGEGHENIFRAGDTAGKKG